MSDWTSVSWLPRPLPLREVMTRLRAALEEREAFFQIAPAAPLELPAPPYGRDGITLFAEHLATRMKHLLNNAFDPRNFGVWCAWREAMSLVGDRIMTLPDCEMTAAFGIDGMKLCRRRPFRWDDPQGFFPAAAETLDRIALYPAPPPFVANGLRRYNAFAMDARLSITDLANGNHVERNFQPDGRLTLLLANGETAQCTPAKVRVWQRDRVEIRASDHRVCYDISAVPEAVGERIPLVGEFRMRLRCGLYCTGYPTRVWKTLELTVRPGGVSDAPDFSDWRDEFSRAPEEGDDERIVNLDLRCDEILLQKTNYPDLPYLYLT